MDVIIWGVVALAIFLVFTWIACFIQAALEKMNLINGACNNVGWRTYGPNEKEVGILSFIPQVREYPPGYPVNGQKRG